LRLTCAPSEGSDTVTLTAKWDGVVLAVQKLDLAKPRQRADFITRVCEGRDFIDRGALESELLMVANMMSGRERSPAACVVDAAEIDVSQIVRPERFIAPDVSGLTVPSRMILDGRPAGRWLLYLRWAAGRREWRPMGEAIDVPDGKPLWIHPQPAEPSATMQPGWSDAARKAWLAGASAPEPADLFKRVCERIGSFLDLPREHAPGITSTLALWATLTYIFQAWPAVPYLYVGGPLGSGKSRVFEILARLVFRPLSSSNMTAPALFRTLHNQGGTLLLDEAERLRQSTPDVGEILSMLLAGYKRGGQATRLEPLPDKGFKPVSFDVYGPKGLACIAGLPPALASRCISLTMFRAAPKSEKARRRIDADPAGWQRLRDDLHALAMEHGPTWLDLPKRIDVCPAMGGRDFELWQPLLALASWIESHGAPGLHALLQQHALAVIEGGRDESVPESDETLLRILADAVRAGERLTPHDILAQALNAEPAEFKNWHPRGVTAALKSYGIPTPKKSGSRRVYRNVTPELMKRIQTSYGIDLGFAEAEPPDPGEPSQ
jgi:hypothetical protein